MFVITCNGIHDNRCVNTQVSILMLQAVNCVYSKEGDRFNMADTNAMQLKYSNHADSTTL